MLTRSGLEPLGAKAVAPWWHSCVLIAFFLVLTLAGIIFQHRAGSEEAIVTQHQNMAPLYSSLIFGQWALLYYVWKVGLRRTGTKLSELIGGRWSGLKDALYDCRSRRRFVDYLAAYSKRLGPFIRVGSCGFNQIIAPTATH